MIPEEAKKKHRLTQEDCDTARLLLARRRTLKEIADIIGVDPSTVGKIRVADYNLEKYLAQRKEMNRKTKERKAAAEAGRRRLNELLEPLVDEERDKKILEQLERHAELDRKALGLPTREAEVPGQMKMELEPEKKDPSPAAQDDAKSMMKFQAAMMDKLLKKLDELIGVLKGGTGNE